MNKIKKKDKSDTISNKTHKRLLINLYEGKEVCVPVEVHRNQEKHEIHHYRVAYQPLLVTS